MAIGDRRDDLDVSVKLPGVANHKSADRSGRRGSERGFVARAVKGLEWLELHIERLGELGRRLQVAAVPRPAAKLKHPGAPQGPDSLLEQLEPLRHHLRSEGILTG